MYTLRNIDVNGCSNHSLGESYSTVSRFENPVRFRELFKDVFEKDHVADLDESSDIDTKNVIQFVLGANNFIIPVYQNESYYIMTNSGQTFEKIDTAIVNLATS